MKYLTLNPFKLLTYFFTGMLFAFFGIISLFYIPFSFVRQKNRMNSRVFSKSKIKRLENNLSFLEKEDPIERYDFGGAFRVGGRDISKLNKADLTSTALGDDDNKKVIAKHYLKKKHEAKSAFSSILSNAKPLDRNANIAFNKSISTH